MDLGASLIWMIIALASLGGLAATGAVLMIKLQRHSEPPAGVDAEAVPTEPWSAQRRARLKRNYFVAAMIVIAVLVVSGLSLLGFG